MKNIFLFSKPWLFVILGLFLLHGCYYDRTENGEYALNPDISFTISLKVASGKNITAVVPVDENNYCYAVGHSVFQVENSQETSIDAPSDILSLARNKTDQSLWWGTYSSGLGCFKDGQITYFNQKTDNFPRDLIRDVICDDKGVVWFNSSAHLLGGLGCYSNGKFSFYTPVNSELPDNLIKSMACRGEKLFIATGGYVNDQKVVCVDDGQWKTLPITGYYLTDLDVDQQGRVYVIDDVGLSSSLMTNKIYELENNRCKDILQEKSRFENSPYFLKTDLRNYLWVARFTNPDNRNLAVYDGETWHEAPADCPGSIINCISVDHHNNIWLGTKDGIYVLKQ
jgi:ligand-binding sensor domain-containing protein